MTYQQKRVAIVIFARIMFLLIFIFGLLQYYLLSLSFLVLLILSGIYYLIIDKIKETTLCLIVENDMVLLMLRNKKPHDVHLNKYNGLGGKVEKGESKTQCVIREVFEEAGVILTDYKYVGKVTFKNFGNNIGKEVMYCFVAYEYKNKIGECDEGELEWVNKTEILHLPLWEGDKYFLMNIISGKKFTAYLHYDGEKVIDYNIKS